MEELYVLPIKHLLVILKLGDIYVKNIQKTHCFI